MNDSLACVMSEKNNNAAATRVAPWQINTYLLTAACEAKYLLACVEKRWRVDKKKKKTASDV